MDVGLEPRLVSLGDEDIIAAPVYDLFGQVALAKHGVADHDLPTHGNQTEQLEGGLVFVGFAIDANLSEDGGHGRGIGGDEVLTGQFAIAAAAENLAVKGDVLEGIEVNAALEPERENGLKLGDIEAAQRAGKGGNGGRLAAREPEGVSERGAVLATKARETDETGASHEHGEDDESKDGRERMDLAVARAWVGHGGEGFVQRACGHGTPRISVRARVPRLPNVSDVAKIN